jgi:hypothetical protein
MHHDPDAHLHDTNADAIFALRRPDRKLLTLYFIYSLMTIVAFPFVFLPLRWKIQLRWPRALSAPVRL